MDIIPGKARDGRSWYSCGGKAHEATKFRIVTGKLFPVGVEAPLEDAIGW